MVRKDRLRLVWLCTEHLKCPSFEFGEFLLSQPMIAGLSPAISFFLSVHAFALVTSSG